MTDMIGNPEDKFSHVLTKNVIKYLDDLINFLYFSVLKKITVFTLT